VLQARSVIGHAVDLACQEETLVEVAVFTLVQAAIVAEHGARPIGGNGTVRDARDSRGVVRPRPHGGVRHIKRVGEDGDLPEHPGVFEVTVGDVAARVVGRD